MSGYWFVVCSNGYDDEDRLVNWNSITENFSTQNRTHDPTHELFTADTERCAWVSR